MAGNSGTAKAVHTITAREWVVSQRVCGMHTTSMVCLQFTLNSIIHTLSYTQPLCLCLPRSRLLCFRFNITLKACQLVHKCGIRIDRPVKTGKNVLCICLAVSSLYNKREQFFNVGATNARKRQVLQQIQYIFIIVLHRVWWLCQPAYICLNCVHLRLVSLRFAPHIAQCLRLSSSAAVLFLSSSDAYYGLCTLYFSRENGLP